MNGSLTISYLGVSQCLDADLHDVIQSNDPKNSFAIIGGMLNHFARYQAFAMEGLAGLFMTKEASFVMPIGRGAKIKIDSTNGFCIRFAPHLLADVVGTIPKSK